MILNDLDDIGPAGPVSSRSPEGHHEHALDYPDNRLSCKAAARRGCLISRTPNELPGSSVMRQPLPHSTIGQSVHDRVDRYALCDRLFAELSPHS